MTKALFFSIVLALASMRAAIAAGPAAYDWSGVYFGVQAGYGIGSSDHSVPTAPPIANDFAVDGGLIGATAGYNLQNGVLVIGIEGDASLAWLKGSTGGQPPLFCPAGPPNARCSTKLNGLETLRVRAGYAWDRILPYVTAGIAVGQLYGATDPGDANSGTTNKVALTVGGGVEAAVAGHWSAKAEYLYVDLGTERTLFMRNPGPFPFDVSLRTHIFRVGLNYHLD